jgi:hypothetical protein
MIEWTNELREQIGSSSRAILTYLGVNGYPVALPLPFTFDSEKQCFMLPMPTGYPSIAEVNRVSLTLLRYDPEMANERYIPFYGQLEEQGGVWLFTPSRVVIQQWGRR